MKTKNMETNNIEMRMAGVRGVVWAMAFAVGALPGIAAAQVQTATAAKVRFTTPAGDAVAGKFFDRLPSRADPLNPDQLVIGLNQGINPVTATSNTFTASTQALHRTAAMDPNYFQVQAQQGYYRSRITYSQRLVCSTARTGLISAGANWVVDGAPGEIGLVSARKCEAGVSATSHTLSGTVDLTGKHLSATAVS